MTKSTIKYIVFSDVHLGHRRTPTDFIINNLKTVLLPLLKQDIDTIFIAGDLFDTLLNNAMPDNNAIKIWMYWLLSQCHQFNIQLRILEGTPSHDRKQSQSTEVVKLISGFDIDYRYIDALYIEHNERLGLNILYIPDEWHENPQVTYQQVLALLKEHHLQKVDIAMMHGMFGYQIPGAPDSIPRHIEQDYLDIVKYYIHIGHVHTFSIYDRIIAQGSFDRLAQNEEEPKGLVWVQITEGQPYFHFVENKHAKIYKTIHIKGKTLEEVLVYLDKKILKYPIESYIRIVGPKNHFVFEQFSELEKRYCQYYLSKKREDELAQPKLTLDIGDDQTEYHLFSINEHNITTLLRDNIQNKYPSFTPQHWRYFNDYIQQSLEV